MTSTSRVLLSARAVVPGQSYRAAGSARLRAMSGDRRGTTGAGLGPARGVRVAAVGIVVAACTKHRAAAPPEPARGTGPIAEALAAERALIAAYDAAAPPSDGDARYLASLLAAHKEHLAALEQAAGIAPSATGSETATSSPTP